MSRVSRVAERKKRRQRKLRLRLGMMMIITLLTMGLCIVDGAHRDILAMGQEVRVLGYHRQGTLHYIQLVGREIKVDQEVVLHQLEGFLGQWRDRLHTVKAYFSQ